MAAVFANTVRPAILAAGRWEGLRRAAERMPVTRKVVARFVPGETLDRVLDSVAVLRDSGRYISVLPPETAAAEPAPAAPASAAN